MRILFYFLLLLSSGAGAQQGLPPVGSWREHLPYNSTLAVGATPDRIWAATPYSLFWVDPASGETGRLSRNTGLSETGIRTAAFDAASRKGFIAYENGNLDVLTGNSIRNIPDLKRAAVNGDKTVYHITAEDGLAYLSTGLGIVVVDASRYEIRDTWPLGEGGQPLRTFQFVRSGSWMYAATAEGLKRAAATATNPADFQQWTTLSAGLPAGAATGVAAVQNRVFAVVHDSVFASEGGAWTLFFANGHGVRSLRASEEKLLLSQQTSDGKGLVLVLEPDGQLVRTLNDPALVADPRDALLRQGEYWVADSLRGLSRWSAAGAQRYAPDGPAGIPAGALVAAGEAVYATGGTGGPGRLFRLADGTWTSWDSASVPAFHSLPGLAPLALDPLDASVWAGSDGGGLLHLKKEGTAEVFTGNSPLQPAPGAPGTYRVTGLHFDAAGSLWIANPGSSPYIHLRRPDGSWQSFPVPFSLPGNALGHLLVDGWDQKWILVPGAGLLVWNHGGDIADTGDDQWRWLRAGAGAGNLPSDNVLSLAFDRNGVAWVGTDNGIGVIPCTADVFATTCEAVLPVIQGDNFANYLFKGEAVHAIAVDGADRKWVGTRNGAWLVAPEGDKVLHQFTAENSPLPGSEVLRIAVSGGTGEVFFATARGLVSYRGTATDAAEGKESDVWVFPNPVPPGYTGTIALRGLPDRSHVKIIEPGGRLVFQTRSLGGQAVWNGRDYRGRQPAPGIYLVLVTNELRTEKVAAKIVFIR